MVSLLHLQEAMAASQRAQTLGREEAAQQCKSLDNWTRTFLRQEEVEVHEDRAREVPVEEQLSESTLQDCLARTPPAQRTAIAEEADRRMD